MNWQHVGLDLDQNKPLYQQVAGRLRRLVLDKEISGGEKIPPSRELQKFFHVSSITVEKGVNILVEEGLFTRRPKLGTFAAEITEEEIRYRRRSAKEEPAVLVIFSDVDPNGYYWFNVLCYLESHLRSAGIRLAFARINSKDRISGAELAAGYDGVIMGGTNPVRIARELNALKVPLVLIGSLDADDAVIDQLDAVVHDIDARFHTAMRHLLDLNHRRIGCITGPAGTQFEVLQRSGIRRALAECGEETDVRFISIAETDIESGHYAGSRILCAAPRVTAILVSDTVAEIGVLKVIRQLSLRIPADVSLVSNGSVPVFGEYFSPRLTTVADNPDELVRIAVEKILGQLQKPDYRKCKTVAGKAELDFGESTTLAPDRPVKPEPLVAANIF